jgi:hypothetical protein
MYKILMVSLLLSCSQNVSRIIKPASFAGMIESRLGTSHYLLHHPGTMFLEEARGKEGQLGYGLWLKDSVSRFTGMSGFIEIERGNGVVSADNDEPAIEYVSSLVLNKSVKWPVNQTETGRFTSFVKVGNLHFSASAPRREGLDSVIAILSTLERH